LAVRIDDFIDVPEDERFPSDWRLLRGMTQVQLASAAGLSTTVISGFERAETRWDDVKATKIAAALGVDLEVLREAWERARVRPAGSPA
ncbi:MAG: helix-turn-helix transcriptional regulator, partial [Thiohalobacteraceae bacterium]